ncbi:MAG: lysophospholipid acyltransferase family protein [Mariprofundaceae bacterium]
MVDGRKEALNAKKEGGPNVFLRWVDRLYCRIWQRLNEEIVQLPQGPLILVGNHRAGVDPLLIQAAVNRPLMFLMAREYYTSMWYARWFFNACGAIPVNPGGANRHSLRKAIAAVRGGQVLCLFPEGAANPDIPLKRILPGAVLIAMETGAPILPFRITGTWPFDHVHLWRPFLRRGRGKVRFGEAFSVPHAAGDKAAVRLATGLMKDALKQLK